MTEPTSNAPEPTGSGTDSAPRYRKRNRTTGRVLAVVGVLLVAAVIAVIALTMGRGSNTPGGPGAEPGTPGAEPKELTVGLTLEPTNLDIRATAGVALDQILIDNIYQGLIGLAPGSVSEFVPVLATELPEVSDDGLTYRFTLREGVSFASGHLLTDGDVVDSLKTTLTEGLLGAAATVSAPEAHVIEIVLAQPNSQLMWHLANRPGLVFESAYTGDLAHTANGTGPYLLEQWKQGDSISFTKNAKYWGEPAELDRVVWRYIPDGNAAVNAAKEGDLDVLAPVLSTLVSQLEGDEDFVLGRADSTDVFTLAYNSARAPLDDVRVRTALSKAIDSDAIVTAFYGDGKPLGGPITDLEPAYEDLTSFNAYDPEGAKELLAEAGVKDLKLTVKIPNFYGTEAINQVVSDFQAVGVTLKVQQVEFATWLSDVYTAPEDGSPRNFDLSYIDHAEANDFVNYVTDGYYFGPVDPKAKALFDQAIAATDQADATELIKQSARIVVANAPAKWLINYTPTNAIGTHVTGFPTSNTNSRISLEGVTVG